MVLIEDDDGNQDIWDVFDVRDVSWQFAGVGSRGSEARVVVEGAFHRRHSTPKGREIGQKMRRVLSERSET
jgi:hypothetical protein